MPELTIHAVKYVRADRAKDVVHIECRTETDTAALNVHSGALSALVLGLRQASEALRSSSEFSGQPLELTGAGLVSCDGSIMLELVFEGALRVVANVPDPAIPILQECLFAMDEIRRPMTTGTTKH
jgi:hypothetical protein